jgi:hypothetical protein
LLQKGEAMLYFIKDNVIHEYPVSKGCTAVYEREHLRDTVPHGVKDCPYCMREWPNKEGVILT